MRMNSWNFSVPPRACAIDAWYDAISALFSSAVCASFTVAVIFCAVNNSFIFSAGTLNFASLKLIEETGYIPDMLYPLMEENYLRTDGETVRRHVFWTLYDNKQEIKCNEGQEMKFLKLEELKGKKINPGQERLCYLAVEQARNNGLIII